MNDYRRRDSLYSLRTIRVHRIAVIQPGTVKAGLQCAEIRMYESCLNFPIVEDATT